MAEHLTDRLVKSTKAPAQGNQITYDDDVRGFGLRTTASGTKAFVLNYRRKADGLERRYTIGAYPDWTVAAARLEASRLRRDVDLGLDPVGEHKSARAAATVADLCDRFEAEYLPRKRPSTQKTYRAQIKSVIRPKLGRKKVAGISFDDIDALHRELSERGLYRANRVIALVSRMFTMAIRWKMRPDNPVKGIERNGEGKRKRYLSTDELIRLAQALDQHSDQQSANIIRLLLLTGARSGETMQAKWADFDLTTGIWTKPGATTKQGTVHVLPLSQAAVQLTLRIRQTVPKAGVWLFPAADGSHRRVVKASWKSVCEAAKITGVRVHDLRHTYASVLVNSGYGLPVIGALLGHTQVSTTHRYVHLFDDPLRAAAERASAILTGAASAEIVPLEKHRRGTQ